MSENILNVNDSNFQSAVLDVADKPVFVDFWATWCGPCRMLAPHMEAAADTYAGKVLITKYNVDESNQIAGQFDIRGIPTVLVFKNGELVDQHTGAMGKAEVEAFIEKQL